MECTLDEAKATIERMKVARSTCAFCAREAFDWFERRTEESRARMLAVGWVEEPGGPAVVLRCYECRDKPTFPWADKLDAEKVRAFMEQKGREQPLHAWWLGELEKTL